MAFSLRSAPSRCSESARPPADVIRLRGGGTAPLVREELRYSTPELLAIERRIVETALYGADLQVGIAHAGAVAAALARRPFLSGEQAAMVRRLTGDGGQIVAVIGKAGTGKTTALAGAHEAWRGSGVPVVGAAVARRAARELRNASGIPSTSLAALLLELRRGGEYALARGSVVVLDEASMVASRDLGELVDHVRSAEGKLVLCGDHRQLPSIRAGGAFRAVAARTRRRSSCQRTAGRARNGSGRRSTSSATARRSRRSASTKPTNDSSSGATGRR